MISAKPYNFPSVSTGILTRYRHRVGIMISVWMLFPLHRELFEGRQLCHLLLDAHLLAIRSHPVGVQLVFVEWVMEDRQIWTFSVPKKLNCDDYMNVKS